MRSDSPLKFGAMLPNARKASPATADFRNGRMFLRLMWWRFSQNNVSIRSAETE
jgi:hypothetical protein